MRAAKHISKILIIDKNQDNINRLKNVLKSVKAEMIAAYSSKEALSKLLNDEFAIILLDVQMPQMKGFEVESIMQNADESKNIPIIFLTDIGQEKKCSQKANDVVSANYIFKSVNCNILKSKIESYLKLYTNRNELKKLNAELSQTNQELEKFAYICSHDLQEPARMMRAFSSLLLEKITNEQSEEYEYAKIIFKNSIYMQDIISDISTYSSLGQQNIRLEEIDCNLILKDILRNHEERIKDTGTKINITQLPIIISCKALVSNIFQNLIGNALKFQAQNKKNNVDINFKEGLDCWCFMVSDNGVGIDPNFYHKVFEPFQREYSKNEFPGTGIGLSASKKFIEKFGGKIWFESERDKGSRFFFNIPKMLQGEYEQK